MRNENTWGYAFTNGSITAKEQATYNAFCDVISEDAEGDIVQFVSVNSPYCGYQDNSDIAGVPRVSYDKESRTLRSYRQVIGKWAIVDGIYTAVILDSKYSQMTKKHVNSIISTLKRKRIPYVMVEQLNNYSSNGDHAFPDEHFWFSVLRPTYKKNDDKAKLSKVVDYEIEEKNVSSWNPELTWTKRINVFKKGEYTSNFFRISKQKTGWHIYCDANLITIKNTIKDVRNFVSNWENTFNTNYNNVVQWIKENKSHPQYKLVQEVLVEVLTNVS